MIKALTTETSLATSKETPVKGETEEVRLLIDDVRCPRSRDLRKTLRATRRSHLLSQFFGQRFRSRRRLDPRPDQVVSSRLERVGLGIPSRPLAVDDLYLVQAPET